MGEFWVYVDNFSCENWHEFASLIAKTKELAAGKHQVCAVIISEERPQLNNCVSSADRILWLPANGSSQHKGVLLSTLARERKPDVILFNAGITSAQVAARTAALLNTGLCADCTDLWLDNGLLVMHRPAFGGGVEADILCPNTMPQMATVRPGIFGNVVQSANNPVFEEIALSSSPVDPIKILEETILSTQQDLRSSKILIAGGLGVGSKENFAILQQLADLLGGQVAATRAAVDAGYANWNQQVGQTGTIVTPKIYIAFGISGSIQHIMGMHASDYIIAVNNDPKAQIFDYADVAIVADWKQTAEYFIETLSNQA